MWSNGKNCVRTLWKKFSRMRKKWLQETPSGIFSARIFHVCIIKSVSPKISRIGRQKRNNNFFYLTKRTHLVTCFRKWHQKVRFPFLFFETCKTWKIWPQDLQRRPWDLKFDTCLTCSYGRTKRCLKMSFTQFVGHLLKRYSGLNFVLKWLVLQKS